MAVGKAIEKDGNAQIQVAKHLLLELRAIDLVARNREALDLTYWLEQLESATRDPIDYFSGIDRISPQLRQVSEIVRELIEKMVEKVKAAGTVLSTNMAHISRVKSLAEQLVRMDRKLSEEIKAQQS